MSKSPDFQPIDWRESRRLRAWALHQQGALQHQIARELGVSQGSVSRWLKQAREGVGIDALHRRPAPGKQARLTNEQFAQIPELMARGAESFGFKGNHWTTKRLAAALQQVFGVAYHPGHVSRLLQKYCPDWRQQD
jgi:transposase